jgi:hypothetical protein
MPVESIDRHYRSTPIARLHEGKIRPAGGVVQNKVLVLAIPIWDLHRRKLALECVPEQQ